MKDSKGTKKDKERAYSINPNLGEVRNYYYRRCGDIQEVDRDTHLSHLLKSTDITGSADPVFDEKYEFIGTSRDRGVRIECGLWAKPSKQIHLPS